MKSPLGRYDPCPKPDYQDALADLIRKEKPRVVVETGLWDGFGAEFILGALDENGKGHLYSIDPMDPNHNSNGMFGNPDQYFAHPIVHERFTFIREYSEKALEPLFNNVGPFDMFIHDSDHSYEVQTFEYESAWRMVRSGGIIVTDDPTWGIPPHRAWWKFMGRHCVTSDYQIGTARFFRKP